MNKYFLIFFMILGVADFAYGLWSKDRISILIGGIMVFIAFSIMKKGKQAAGTSFCSPGLMQILSGQTGFKSFDGFIPSKYIDECRYVRTMAVSEKREADGKIEILALYAQITDRLFCQ